MENFKAFLKRKDIEISAKRYGIDALGAMAQGLFCSLLIGTIINTIGSQFHIPFLTNPVATVAGADYTVGGGDTMRRTGRAIHANIEEAVYKCTKDIEKYGREAQERIKKAIETGVKAVHTAAVTKAPGGRTGNLRAGIKMSVTSTGTTAGGNVRSTAPHGHLATRASWPNPVPEDTRPDH